MAVDHFAPLVINEHLPFQHLADSNQGKGGSALNRFTQRIRLRSPRTQHRSGAFQKARHAPSEFDWFSLSSVYSWFLLSDQSKSLLVAADFGRALMLRRARKRPFRAFSNRDISPAGTRRSESGLQAERWCRGGETCCLWCRLMGIISMSRLTLGLR